MSKHFCQMRKPVAALVAILICALLPRSANAAMQMISFDEPLSAANDFHREIEIPQFEASLGSLQSISLDLQTTGTFENGPHRHGAMPHDLTIVLETADHETLISLKQSVKGFGPQGRRSDFSEADDFAGTHFQPITAEGKTTLTSPEDLKEFTGSAFVDLFLSAQDTWLKDRHPDCRDFFNGSWVVGADLKVIYNFVPVPESSTWLAAGFAVFVLLLVTGFEKKRRREGGVLTKP